ncbi:MAG: hypothetical protein M3R43_11585 [Acidobacteriota bacterium]|nr:hypothetical protein [Acidobacteriota bacterium]
MLDVHAPEHNIHNVRDFFIHLMTITVGLLIALGLEASVEAMHHRHQRQEAEATIREEIRQNRDDLVKAQNNIHTEIKNMVKVLDFLQARVKGQTGDAKGLTLEFNEGPLQDAAWRTAASTGVVSYMDYAAVEKYAVAYKEQGQFEVMEQQALDEYLQLDSYVVKGFDPTALNADDVKAALPDVRRALAHLEGMLDVSRGTLRSYDDALK